MSTLNKASAEAALAQATHNRAALEREQDASCFFCLRTYPTALIVDWTDKADPATQQLKRDESGQTALCPHCGIDSVMPGKVPLRLLTQLNEVWFGNPSPEGL